MTYRLFLRRHGHAMKIHRMPLVIARHSISQTCNGTTPNDRRNILNNVCDCLDENMVKNERRMERKKAIIQTSSSVHSPALLFRSTSAFFNTMLEKRLPIPLMAVMANMTLRLPSMLVLRIRKMCWNFSGMTKDWKQKQNGKKVRSRQEPMYVGLFGQTPSDESHQISKGGHVPRLLRRMIGRPVDNPRRFERMKITKVVLTILTVVSSNAIGRKKF